MKKAKNTFILTLFVLLIGCSPSDKKAGKNTAQVKEKEGRGFVSLFVNFGEEVRRFPQIPWKEGQTVRDIMMQVEADVITLQVIDTLYGDMGHLIIGFTHVRNQSPNYWVYCINGMKANRGVDDLELKNGDRITWHYTSDDSPCEEDKEKLQ